MREINANKILKALDVFEVSYSLINFKEQVYKIASLFDPIPSGFYYLVGKATNSKGLQDSLIICTEENQVLEGHTNSLIVLNGHDPQEVYYQILNEFFRRKSTAVISKLCVVDPSVKLGKAVQIDEFTVIDEGVIIEDDVIIGNNVKIHENTVIKSGSIIESGSVIGAQGVAWVWSRDHTDKIVQPQLGGVLVENDCFLGAGTIIVRGSLNEKTRIGKKTLMAPGCRIGHGTIIDDYVHFANNVITGGNTVIGGGSFVGSGAIFRPKVKLHNNTIVGAGSVVVKNTTSPGKTLIGVPAKEMSSKDNPSGMPRPKL